MNNPEDPIAETCHEAPPKDTCKALRADVEVLRDRGDSVQGNPPPPPCSRRTGENRAAHRARLKKTAAARRPTPDLKAPRKPDPARKDSYEKYDNEVSDLAGRILASAG